MPNPGLHRDPRGFTQTEFDPDTTKSKRSHSTTVVLSNKHQQPLTSKNLQLQAMQVRFYLPTLFLFFKTTHVSSRTLAFVYLLLFNSPVLGMLVLLDWEAAPQVALCWTCCLKRSRILSHRSSATSRTVPVRLASKACQSQNIATQLMQKQINMKKEMSTHSPSKKARGEKSSVSFIERCMHAKNRQLLCLLIPWS